MNIITNIEIPYSAGVGKTETGFVSGFLGTKAFMENGDVKANWTYTVPNGDIRDATGSITILEADVQAMYDAVSTGLPDPNVSFNDYISTVFYKAFINEMVSSFDGLTSASQVDLVQ